jgi:hypothetical protein
MEAKAKKNRVDANDAENQDLLDSRSRLVRVPRIVDSSIFGGWGIKL